jgi:hypothetical protein
MQRSTVIKLWILGFLILPAASGIVGARYGKVVVDKVRAHFNPPRLTVEALLKSNRLPLPILPIVDEPGQYKPVEFSGHAFDASAKASPDTAPDEPQESSVVQRKPKVRRVVVHRTNGKHRAVVAAKSARTKKQQHATTAAFTSG